ncbi:MAG: rsbT co-antagonist protein RsbR, partial [Myxococcota bacterium]
MTPRATSKRCRSHNWKEFFRADIGDKYIESRRLVGSVHATIGLSLRAYFTTMNTMLSLILRAMEQQGCAGPGHCRAVAKLVHLDTSIVVDTLTQIKNQTISQQSAAIMAMSTPVTRLWDGILLLPVVGLIDNRRSHDVMNAMLHRINETGATVFILDISGVAVMDTAVANHLMKMSKAARLMGCLCIISGVSPAIASTIVELGIDVGGTRTLANLKDAFALAFAETGVVLVPRAGDQMTLRWIVVLSLGAVGCGGEKSNGNSEATPSLAALRVVALEVALQAEATKPTDRAFRGKAKELLNVLKTYAKVVPPSLRDK